LKHEVRRFSRSTSRSVRCQCNSAWRYDCPFEKGKQRSRATSKVCAMSVSLCYWTSKADSAPFIACPPSGFQSDEAFTVNEWPEEYPTADPRRGRPLLACSCAEPSSVWNPSADDCSLIQRCRRSREDRITRCSGPMGSGRGVRPRAHSVGKPE
jgi:hypothetical protein